MEYFIFGCGKLNTNNNRWYRPILLRSVKQETELGGGDWSRFNNWSTRNHSGNHQFKPRGFVQNKRFKPSDQEAKTGPDGQCVNKRAPEAPNLVQKIVLMIFKIQGLKLNQYTNW